MAYKRCLCLGLPSFPPVNKTVLIGGFPGVGKRLTGSELTFGLYFAATSVDSVNERDISMVREPDEEMTDIAGKGLPPRNFELGGMSGGPAIAVLDNDSGILSWRISGVIYECNPSLEITKAARADLIGDDGVIHG